MTEYEKIVDKMIKKYPHARAAFQYFLEQSHYDSMEEFLFDYGYMIDYDLEKYTENEYFYKDGMNNLYYDTIKRRRLQKTADGDTVYRYIHAEDEDDSSNPPEAEVDMDYSLSGEIVSAGAGKSIVFSVAYQDEKIQIFLFTLFPAKSIAACPLSKAFILSTILLYHFLIFITDFVNITIRDQCSMIKDHCFIA